MATMAFDEFGRPVVLLREQAQKERARGLEAHKQNIAAARTVADILRTSLGPRGMDKMLISPDGDVTITNDGATILDKIDISNEVAKLMVQLSKAQDAEIGDGTTGVVVLAGALLTEAESLLDKGIHAMRIAEGFERACEIGVERLKEIAEDIPVSLQDADKLRQVAESSLNSKVVSRLKKELAKIVVDAVLSVADTERGDVNLELIKFECKAGGSLDETCLVRGIVLDKEMSHPQMPKEIENAKIAVLTCPFEPPKPKTKHKVDLQSADDYKKLHEIEQAYFRDEAQLCKASGATLVICQWGFDDEANHLLLQNNLPAVRWVGGVELELLAMATKARIVPRFAELNSSKLGFAGRVREVHFGTQKDKMLFIEQCEGTKSVTIFIRGGNAMVLDEAKRSLHDALCSVRNLVRENKIVYGGGSCEIAASMAIRSKSDDPDLDLGIARYAVRSFADALDAIPIALAENSGLPAVRTLADAKLAQEKEKNPTIGINCMQREEGNDMKKQGVYECLSSKIQQFRLATQVVKMILKIDDVILNAKPS